MELKEKKELLEESGINKEHEDYRYYMGWKCQKVELLCSKIRAVTLEEKQFEFYGNPDYRNWIY